LADPDLVAAVERAALWAWPPREVRFLHGWLLRAGGPLAPRRVSSAQTLAFDASDRLAAAIGETEAWYAARGLPACFQLTDVAAPPGLDAVLAERGYVREGESLVMLGDPATAAAADGGAVEILHRPRQSALAAMADPLWGDAQRRERAALLARIRRPHRYGLVTVGGEPAAGGLVVADGALAGLFALRTQPPFRRQGLARRLVAALSAWAREQGAEQLYLQVEAENAPALALYAGLGFAAAYRYGYRKATDC
jgi:ribosomal protein S18 acetylase RimI-like enzyme